MEGVSPVSESEQDGDGEGAEAAKAARVVVSESKLRVLLTEVRRWPHSHAVNGQSFGHRQCAASVLLLSSTVLSRQAYKHSCMQYCLIRSSIAYAPCWPILVWSSSLQRRAISCMADL